MRRCLCCSHDVCRLNVVVGRFHLGRCEGGRGAEPLVAEVKVLSLLGRYSHCHRVAKRRVNERVNEGRGRDRRGGGEGTVHDLI